MNYTTYFLLLLLASYSCSVIADENPAPIMDIKAQPSPSIPDVKPDADTIEKKLPTGPELVQLELEKARLMAELERKKEIYAKRPKRKFISASTQAYEYRAYMAGFVKKTEDIGNANYPEVLKKKNLGGQVVVTVSIGRDGSVEEVAITKSSNIPELDAAVLTIMDMAKPFAPLPETKEDIDFLHITRTWDFSGGDPEPL